MRLFFSTGSFNYAGRARAGFPIILGDDLRPVQPAQDFLIWLLLGRGRALSPLTWEDYGRRLWDYFAFLNANNLKWDELGSAPGTSAVARYRDWTLGELGLKSSTLNSRLRIVISFYEWAKERGLIERLPYAYSEVRSTANSGFLGHAKAEITISTPVLLQREWEVPPEFLSRDQVKTCLHQGLRAGPRILFDLMVRVGLRSCEARTFPLKYVFDPRARTDCNPAQMIRVRLDPADMWIKFRKPREVDIPYSLMCDLYAYTLYERNRLRAISGVDSSALVLNFRGRPYEKGSLIDVFKGLSAQVGFRVRPLQLRHSYAIHTLARLREDPNYKGEPLLYVRDRLGHSSVQTTMVYLRQIEQLAGGVVLAIEDEFNKMFDRQ